MATKHTVTVTLSFRKCTLLLQNHWIDSLDQQHSDFQRDFDYLKVVMEKVENEGKQLINLHRFTNGDPFSELR